MGTTPGSGGLGARSSGIGVGGGTASGGSEGSAPRPSSRGLGATDRGGAQASPPSIRCCYQRELSKDSILGGSAVVEFEIGADGAATVAEVGVSTLGDDAAEQCTVGRFKRRTSPVPKGSGTVSVSYPFVFSPE